jgi:hypothetical protein
MLCAIDICDPAVVLSNEYVALTPLDPAEQIEVTYEAVERLGSADNDLEPKLNGSYALMSTGDALDLEVDQWLDTQAGGIDPYVTDEIWEIYDVLEWRLELQAPAEAKAFRFKYVFLSAEYDEFIASDYNDKFYVILDAESTAQGEPTVINFAECRDPDLHYDFVCDAGDPNCTEGEKYCYLAVNSALSECCWYPQGSFWLDDSEGLEPCPNGFATTDISGTGFECAASADIDGDLNGSSTGWLQTSWPIEPGETFDLTFHIHDTNDGLWNTEVILDAFEFLTEPTQGTEVVVE